MTIESDILLSASKAKGKRPYFFDDPMVERVLSVTMALASELSVTQERLATLEQLLIESNILQTDSFDTYQPNQEQLAERGRRQQAMINRLLRLLRQDVESTQNANEEKTCEEIASSVNHA